MFAYLVQAALVCMVVWLLTWPRLRWRYRHIPGPMAWPLIGNLLPIIRLGLPTYVQQLEAQYGPIFKYWFGAQPIVVVCDPDISRQLCMRFNARSALFEATNIMSGDDLKQDRLGIFVRNLSSYAPVMDGCAGRLVGRLARFADSGEVIDMWRELGNMTLEVVGECAYGVDFHALDDGRTASDEQLLVGQRLVEACRVIFKQGAIEQMSPYVPIQLMFPALADVVRAVAARWPDPRYLLNQKSRHELRGVTSQLIQAYRNSHSPPAHAEAPAGPPVVTKGTAEPSEDVLKGSAAPTGPGGNAQEGAGGHAVVKETSFLSALLMGKGREGEPRMNDLEVTAQAFTFLLAGYETTANTLAFAVYLLSASPKAQTRLLAEVDAFGKEGDKTITAADMAQFPYAMAVVRETLRLHSPAANVITRLVSEEVEVLGKTIPKDAFVFIPAHSFHVNPKFWPRANEFLPERFMKEEEQKRARGKDSLFATTGNAYIPFGVGARMCVGYKFAEMEATLALVRLYHRYTFELIPGMGLPIETKTGITTGPAHGVPVTVHRR